MTHEELESVIYDVLTRALPLELKADTIVCAAELRARTLFTENTKRGVTSANTRSTRNVEPGRPEGRVLELRPAARRAGPAVLPAVQSGVQPEAPPRQDRGFADPC